MLRSLRHQIISFILLTLVLSTIPYYFMLSAGSMRADGGLWVLGVMWCPGIAGMMLQFLERRSLRGLGWGWGNTRHQLWSYLLPLAYATPAYVVVWTTGLGGFPNAEAAAAIRDQFGLGGDSAFVGVAFRFAIVATLGVIAGLLSATGEEIGWRGFLVPRLVTLAGPTRASLFSGSIWALWHFPGIFLLDYNGGTPGWYSATMFFIMVLSISFAFTWLRVASGSLWTGAILHASHNSFIQTFFDRVTVPSGSTPYLTGEFGIGLALTAGITGYLIWRKTMREDQLQATREDEDSPATHER